MTRELYELRAEVEGIIDQLSMIAYAISGSKLTDVELTDKATASQLWSISNHLERINSDLETLENAY